MSFSTGPADDEELVASINTTPLVDVMLVLLIIFLITIPVAIQAVPLELPQERSSPTQGKPDNIQLAVSADGQVFWNLAPVDDYADLRSRLKQVAAQSPQPEVHVRGDRNAPYAAIGRVLAACQQVGIAKVGLLAETPPANMGSAPWP